MQKKSLCADDSTLETIEKYSLMVYRLAYSLVKNESDADDIHQEVFVRYITSNPVFENAEHEKAWFIRVTTNLCKNLWKTAWKRKVISLSEYEEVHRESTGIYGKGAAEAEENTIIDVVKLLPQKYRVVIHIFYYEEMSIEEISKVLGLNPSTVRTHLTRARRKLGKILEEDI